MLELRCYTPVTRGIYHTGAMQAVRLTELRRRATGEPVNPKWTLAVQRLLEQRGWPLLGAEAAADEVSTYYYVTEERDSWSVRYTDPPVDGMYALYRVSRGLNGASVYESKFQARATEVAEVLNEIDRRENG